MSASAKERATEAFLKTCDELERAFGQMITRLRAEISDMPEVARAHLGAGLPEISHLIQVLQGLQKLHSENKGDHPRGH